MKKRVGMVIVMVMAMAMAMASLIVVGTVVAAEGVSGEKIVEDANYLQQIVISSHTYPSPDKEKLQGIEPAMLELDQRLGELKKTKENLTSASAILNGYIESKTGLKSEEMTGNLRVKINTSQEIEGSIKQEKFPERIWGNFTIYYEDSEISRLVENIQPLISGAEVKLPGKETTEIIFANIVEKQEVSVLDILALNSAVNQWKAEINEVESEIEKTQNAYQVMLEKRKHPFLQREFAVVETANGVISLVIAIIIGYLVFWITKHEGKGDIAGTITFFVTLAVLTAGVIAVIL